MKRVVWIISEGSPGHVSQSEGLVAALARRTGIELHIVQTRPRFGGFVRQFVRKWMGIKGNPLPAWFLKHFLKCEVPDSIPNLIVTSGGKAVFAARSLAVRHGAPLVFIGERKPYPSRWFHTVFTPSPFEADVYDVPIELIPTDITPAKVDAAASAWKERPRCKLWTMVVGGASRTHRYTDEDWKTLGLKMNALAEANDIRWLVSTSRRTGKEAEAILRTTILPAHIASAVWWAHRPLKMMHAFLGSAGWVFATQDSVTMVSEAIASGRPVVVTMPAGTSIDINSFMSGYFERLEKAARIIRLPFDRLADFQPALAAIQPRTESINSELAATLVSRLHWSHGH